MIRKGILPLLLLSSVALAPAFSQEAQAPDANNESLTEQIIAYGGEGGGHHGEGREHGKPDFISKLNITDDQLEKLAALKSQYEDKTAVRRTELHSIMRQIGDAMSQTAIDRARVTSLHNKAQSIKDDLSNARLSYMLDRADVFTADQRAQMHHWKLVHQFMGHHHGHGGWGHHGGA